jgi:hypothetical protein
MAAAVQDDEDFKSKYDQKVLRRQTTLALKTSFHTINIILMGLCQVFSGEQDNGDHNIEDAVKECQKEVVHEIEL